MLWPPVELSLPALFLAGLGTSLHCSLMCGALQGVQLQSRGGMSLQQTLMLIHSGRLLGYTTLGAVAGALGAPLLGWLPAEQGGRVVQVLAAVTLVMAALLHLRKKPLQHSACGLRKRNGLMRLPEAPRLFIQGLMWAALPCGILYAVLLLAALAGSAVSGALLLAAFGLGTVPLLGMTGGLWGGIIQRASPQHWRATGAAALLALAAVSTWSAVTQPAGLSAIWCAAPQQ